MKKWLKTLLIVIAAVVILVGALIALGAYRTSKAIKEKYDVTPSLSIAEPNDVALYVSASGNISALDEVKIFTSAYGEITQQNAEEGQKVSAGQVLAKIDSTQLEEDIEQLESDIFYKELEIEKSVFSDDVYYIKAPIAGEVKDIKVHEDDDDTEDYDEASDISEVMDEYGYIALISPVDKMYVITDEEADFLTVGTEVKVSRYDYEYNGVVEKIEDGKTYILADTDNISLGGRVSIYLDGSNDKVAGEAQLYEWVEVDVPTSEGRISKIYAYNNKEVEKGERLFRVTARSQEMVDMYDELEELKQELLEKQEMLENLEIKSPVDGIVTQISIDDGEDYDDDVLAYVLADTSYWVVNVDVDELDINLVKEGMKAEVTVDAYDDETFYGTVISISSVGESTNGVTSYEVGIEVENNDIFKLNMTANAEIEVSFIKQTLTVPVEAVRSDNGKNYVVVYTNPTVEEVEKIKTELIAMEMGTYRADGGAVRSQDASSGDMEKQNKSLATDLYSSLSIEDKLYGKLVEVEVGLMNETYAQILSGVVDGETIILPSVSGDSANDAFAGMPGMGRSFR